MPTQLEVYQFWSINTKRRCFRKLKMYPALKKEHNSKVEGRREQALEFRVKWLLRVHFGIWKRNILVPCTAILQEADKIRRLRQLGCIFFELRLGLVRLTQLEEVLAERLEQVDTARKIAIMCKWRASARDRSRERGANQLSVRVQRREFATIVSAIASLSAKIHKCNIEEAFLRQNSQILRIRKTFGLWTGLLNRKREAARETAEALRFHHEVINPLAATTILRRALERAENAENCAAEEVAQQAKTQYLREQCEKRAQLYELALNAERSQTYEATNINATAAFFEVSKAAANQVQTFREREQPAIPENLGINFDAAHESLIKERESIILQQINNYKETLAATTAASDRLEAEQEKLFELQRRLDETAHPWSCRLEIENQQSVVKQHEVELARLQEQTGILKHGLREIKQTI